MFCLAISARAFRILDVSGAGWPGVAEAAPLAGGACCRPPRRAWFCAGEPSGVVDSTSIVTNIRAELSQKSFIGARSRAP